MRLFINGHAHRLGYEIARVHAPAEIRALSPLAMPEPAVRFVQSRRRAYQLCERWNRRFGSPVCPMCDGAGRIGAHFCPACAGMGTV